MAARSMTYNEGMRPALLLLSLAACAAPGRDVEVLARGPGSPVSRLAVAGVAGADAPGWSGLPRLLASALGGRFDAVAAADADTVISSAELGPGGSSPAALAELRRATGAEAVVFATLAPGAAALELAALDARTGDVLLRVRVRPRGGPFSSPRAAADAGAAALSPLSRRRRAKPSLPDEDELPPP